MRVLSRISAFVMMVILLAATGCGERQAFAPDDVGLPVVDAILVVDRHFPSLYLGRSIEPDQPFLPSRYGIVGAGVTVRGPGIEVAYEQRPAAPGWYRPTSIGPLVLPGTEYELEITTAQGETVRARTLTPGRFSVRQWLLLDSQGERVVRELKDFEESGAGVYDEPENQVVYDQGLLEARFDRPEAVALQVGLSSLDFGSDYVIDPDFFDEEDFDDLERENFSPMFEGRDGFVRLPWFAIFFEGRYKIRVWATDRNWNDLVVSNPSFNQGAGFGGNAGDGFDRPIFHVDGGLGIFASASVDSLGFRILPPENSR